MRVVLIGPVYPFRGGIAHYTAMLAEALAARHETLVISFSRQYPSWLYPGKSDRDPSREPLRTKAEYLLDPLFPWTWWRTASRVREFGADLVVMQWWTTFWAPAFGVLSRLLRQQGRPPVIVIHNVTPHEAKAWDRWTAKFVLGQARGLVAQSRREMDRLRQLMPGAVAILAPMPAYDGLAATRVSREDARRKLGIPPDARVALFFGVVRPYKGLGHLLDAAALMRDRGAPVTVIVAGQIWAGKELYLQQIARLGLEGLVRLDDRYIPNEELPSLFAACDVFAAPYVDGTQSASVRTAMAYGVPIVATDVAAAELGPGTGRLRLVPAGDAPALAQGLEDILAEERGGGKGAVPAPVGWADVVDALERAARA